MIIWHKGLFEERYDAPFVGMLIAATDCRINCPNCINEWIRSQPIIQDTTDNIFSSLESNNFLEGIILGGLEWTYQKNEMTHLLNEAVKRGYKAMLYTGLYEEEFKIHFPDVYDLPIYIKFGQYIDGSKPTKDSTTGITLASDNQYIRDNTRSTHEH